ncbi:MAG: alpha/beta hydrolase [Acidobacteria bacterium]|nr:alpha/beta hydrolase [Acidobacteriota bacterium]
MLKQLALAAVIMAVSFLTASANGPLKPCKLSGVDEELLCGKLSVFENRRTHKGRKISLNVVVLPALESKNKQAPLFDLAGGPGLDTTSGAWYYTTALREYRRHSDVVLVDQRGTGESNPLRCDKIEEDYLDETYPVKYVEACRAKLERLADLTQYTTSIAMDDLDDVRAWLGYERINLIGLSYGTRAALVYLRQHPDRVRSVVLMGVVPTNARVPMYHARNGQRGMDLLFADCEADVDCNREYPRLREEFNELLAALGRNPARVKYRRTATPFPAIGSEHSAGPEIELEIRREQFAEELRSQLYAPPSARRVPFIIHQAAKGNFTPFLKVAIPDNPAMKVAASIADGMYLSVTCTEDVPFIDTRAAEQMNSKTFFGNYRVEQQVRACKYWPRGSLPADYQEPVVAKAPVLIISGYMDPVTAPDWAAEVASHLPNSRLWIIRNHAHVPMGLTNFECFDGVIMKFLGEPDPIKLDTSCGDQMLAPKFFIQ